MESQPQMEPKSVYAGTRRWPRHHVNVPVMVVSESRMQRREVAAIATELNEGGLALCTDIDLSVGDVVEIAFVVSCCALPLKFKGVVRNRHRYGCYYGIEFLDTSEAQRGEIVLLCQVLRSDAGFLDS